MNEQSTGPKMKYLKAELLAILNDQSIEPKMKYFEKNGAELPWTFEFLPICYYTFITRFKTKFVDTIACLLFVDSV